VELESGTFDAGLKNIKIIYMAGYEEVPGELQLLATKWVGFLLKGKDRLGVSSQSSPDGSLTVFDAFADSDMKEILDAYTSRRYDE